MKQAWLTLSFFVHYAACRINLRRRALVDFLEAVQRSKETRKTISEKIGLQEWSGLYANRRLRRFLRANCLNTSVAIYAMMVRRGWTPTLHLGVKKTEKGLEGHCWLTHDGEYLSMTDEMAARDYAEILCHGGAAN